MKETNSQISQSLKTIKKWLWHGLAAVFVFSFYPQFLLLNATGYHMWLSNHPAADHLLQLEYFELTFTLFVIGILIQVLVARRLVCYYFPKLGSILKSQSEKETNS